MQKDYARRLQRKQKTAWKSHLKHKSPRARTKKPIWTIVLVICALLLFFVGVLFYISQHIPTTSSFFTNHFTFTFFKKQPKLTSKHLVVAIKPHEQPTQFDFYNMLPKIKVTTGQEVTESAANKIPTETQEIYEEKAKTEPVYILQIASVQSASEARKIQNLLIEKEFTSRIVPIARGDKTWYRIQIGPFKNEAEAESTKTLLQKQKIHSILISNDELN